MFKRFSTNNMVLLFLVDNALIQLAFWGAVRLGQGALESVEPAPSLYLAIGLLWSAILLMFSCYTPRQIILWYDEFQKMLVAHTVAALSLAGLLFLSDIELARSIFAYFYSLALLGFLGYRASLRVWYRINKQDAGSVARILLVGASEVGQNLVAEFKRQQWPGIEFVGFVDNDPDKQSLVFEGVPVLGPLQLTTHLVQQHQVDEIIIALPRKAQEEIENLAARLYGLPVNLRIVPDYFDLAFHGATIERLGNYPLIGLRDPAIDGFQRFAKRLLDISISSAGLLLVSPILLVAAIAIKLEDRGSIFYLSPRAGENGRTFHMVKFRSMVQNADKIQDCVNQTDADSGALLHKSKDDPRVTKVGRIMRRTSIDELPQLWNVLKGEMSIVGPRPELPWLVEDYEPWQRKRFAVPQGITGWWQVNGRSDNMMHLNTDQDLYYIRNYSLWLDVQILWKTVGVVFKGKGAY